MKWFVLGALVGLALCALFPTSGHAEQYQVGKVPYRTNSFGLTPSDNLVIDGIEDPKVSGVTCWWSKAEIGGISGSLGLAENPSDVSLACRQTGPIQFSEKFAAKEFIAKESRDWLSFKTMQVVRLCDVKKNSLIYLVYSDKILEGSPKNAISVVPIQPWGSHPVVACKDNLK